MQRYRLLLVSFGLSLAFSCWYMWAYGWPWAGMDDANIFFVYGKNFLSGHGFRYFHSGEKVEGFTSFAWMWVVIIVQFFTDSPGYVLVASGVMLNTFSLWFLARSLNRMIGAEESEVTLPAVLLFMMCGITIGYYDWTVTSQMENPLWMFMFALLVFHLVRFVAEGKWNALTFSLCAGTLYWVRPEGIAWALVAIAAVFYAETFRSGFAFAGRRILFPLAILILLASALTFFRLTYFGYPLPNTWYAKVSADKLYTLKDGLRYLRNFLFLSHPVYLPLTIIASLPALRFIRRILVHRQWAIGSADTQIVLSVMVVAGLCLPVLSGGDHFSLHRQYQPLIPLMWMLTVHLAFTWQVRGKSFRHLASGAITWPYATAAACISLLLVLPFNRMSDNHLVRLGMPRNKIGFNQGEWGQHMGKYMNDFFPPDLLPSHAVTAAGGIAYRYNGETYDMMGLNNTQMAHADKWKYGYRDHASFSKDVFFSQSPDMVLGDALEDTTGFVMAECKPGFSDKFYNWVLRGLFYDPRFLTGWDMVILSHPDGKRHFSTYARKHLLEGLSMRGYGVRKLERCAVADQ